VALAAIVFAISFSGCLCARGTVNSSDSLRWWLFSNFGAQRICPEMLKRGVPLKLNLLGASSVGRFFPAQCAIRLNDAERTVVVDVTGSGYAVLPVTRRVGFYAGLSIEYGMDFRLEDDATYVWGRYRRLMAAPDIRLLGVENSMVSLATQTPLGDLATLLGRGIIEGELAKGFTVVRLDDGDDFTLGHLEPPERPKRQFASGGKAQVLASDQSELRAASRDYIGPLEIASNDATMTVRLRVTGPAVDYLLVDKALGDAWRQPYEAARPIGPPPGNPLAFGQAPLGDTVRNFPLARGYYYLVVENRSPAPVTAFGVPMPFEPVSTVAYSIEVAAR
jgi:hypothetical protein